MVEFFISILLGRGWSEQTILYLSNAMALVVLAGISVLAYLVARKIIVRVAHACIKKRKAHLDEILANNKVLEFAALIVPLAVIYGASSMFAEYYVWIQRIASCFIVFVTVQTLSKLLDSVDDIYNRHRVSRVRPIKGYLQVVKIIAHSIGVIVIVSIIIDRSPWLLLSGIGAATAVLLLIFQNSIQGLVAGIQLSANDMVRLGDWIEMAKYDANGHVIEISLHTVKVQNWNKTISTIPSYSLITESFKNWRGMQEAGARRIKRCLHVDMTCVRLCTPQMLEKYQEIAYMQEYLEGQAGDGEIPGGAYTNLRLFQAYFERYLTHHPGIHQGMTKLVRQLEPTSKGLPIEVYAFTSDTAWNVYEAVQSEIFDHMLAMLPAFDLRVFQDPLGSDLKKLFDAQIVQ